MEVAAYLSDKAASVSCIDITAVPFERVLGEHVGKMLQEVSSPRKRRPASDDLSFLFQMHEENGVKFYLGSGVKEIVEHEGRVAGVTLPSGETLEAEMVVAGVGE